MKGSQVLQPLFEFSGACAGCGETPYLKLLTQLFGDRPRGQRHRVLVDLWRQPADNPVGYNGDGRGPAWANSLFEDNAEFGLGLRLAVDRQAQRPRACVVWLRRSVASSSTRPVDQSTEPGIEAQRKRVAALQMQLATGVAARSRGACHCAALVGG